MNTGYAKYRFFKGNLFAIIGVMLCVYFSYHSIFGHRSILALKSLEHEISKSDTIRDNATKERHILEVQVLAMRPDSINPDLLEERARHVLGYMRSDEIHLLSN
ncbi:MAG: septum formation initiator family protein [Bdellovibrionales bacterium]